MMAWMLGLASSALTSMAPPLCTSATTLPLAAAVTAAMSACCAAEKSIEVRSWPSASSSRSLPTASTTRSAAAAAAAAAATPEVSLLDTEGTPLILVAVGMCWAMASKGVKCEWLHGSPP